MKKIICFIFVFSFFHNSADAQWIQQTSGVGTSLLDIDFVNENTGWACGDNGVIVKTTNGGVNWVQQSSGITNRLEGIDAVDQNLVWCVGWWNTILKSTDGGNNWQIIRSEPTPVPTFRKVYFLNQNTGWILKSNYILRTTNGGNTFDSTHTIFTFLWDIYFKNSLTGVLCGDGALTMKSTDGGVTWNQILLPLLMDAPNLYRLSFIGDIGWTIGEGDNSGLGKLVFKTTNFGNTWDSIARVQYPSGNRNYSVFFTNLNTGYAGGTNGYMYKSTNGGLNWYQQVITGGGFRNDINFVNDTTGWVVGGGGQIFKTTTGGQFVGIELYSNIIPNEFVLSQNYPNPFNNVTVIKFQITASDNYRLEIFDMLGRKVTELLNQSLKPGKYKIRFTGDNLASGNYFYRLSSGKYTQTKKFTLVK
ncbi:MAG TPA: YCF48-related protein [Ignavibacteria bacterium]|nr:YCF48-related protein [Ignavibacteria bacterium]